MHRHRMISCALIVALSAGLGSVASRLLADHEKDGKIEGTWEQTLAERDGVRKSLANATNARALVTFADGTAIFQLEREPVDGAANIEVVEMKYTLDTSKTPHQIDLISVRDGKEVRRHGIFKFEKDELVIALDAHAGKGRPREFATKKGDGFDMLTLTPAKNDKAVAKTKDADRK